MLKHFHEMVLYFDEHEEVSKIMQLRKQKIEETAEKILADNMEAFLELAK